MLIATILKNNFCRMASRLPGIIFMTVITLLSIILAVYITGTQQVKGHLVFVSSSATLTGSKAVSVVNMKKEPPFSCLVKQQYDAYILDRGDGTYQIKTLKNAQFKNTITALLKNPGGKMPAQTTDRNIGVNIVGFLMMFLLMSVSMNFFAFAEDKEDGQLARVLKAPVPLSGYLAANYLSCFVLFVPAYIMLAVMKLCGFSIGFSLAQFALLFLFMGLIGISFFLLLHTLIRKPDNATMLGNTLLVLTTILSGSFYPFGKDNRLIENLTKILPQKAIMDYAQAIQNSNHTQQMVSGIYVVIFAAVLFFLSYAILARKTAKG